MEKAVKLLARLREEEGASEVTGFLLAIVVAAVLLMIGAYVVKKIAGQLNDTDVSTMADTIVSGFNDGSSFLGITVIIFFVGVILGVLFALRG